MKCVKKVARQINALARISRYLDKKSISIIYSSFIASNFSYCPLVWHFCGMCNNNKLEKLHKRSLRILHNDFTSSYRELLFFTESDSMLCKRLKYLLLHVFRCLQHRNPEYLNNMFQIKELSYSLRNALPLIQPTRQTTNNGLRTISYLGSKLWNEISPMSQLNSSIDNTTESEFKCLLNTWTGPDPTFLHQYL